MYPLDLHKVWSPAREETKLRVGVNIMFNLDHENGLGETDDMIWRKRAKSFRRTLTLNGRLYPFYTVPSELWYRKRGINALEVEARVFSTYFPGQVFQAEDYHSPLAGLLWDALTGNICATELHRGDLDLGRLLVTFDILEATASAFTEFLGFARGEAAWKPPELSNGTPENDVPLIGHLELISDFAKAVRDLTQCQDLTLEAIERTAKFDDECRQKFDILKHKSKTQRIVLENAMRDLKEDMDGFVSRNTSLMDKSQSVSLKLLTIVASIFLPLTTACSLLSMTTRFNALGPLLWDWAGMVVVIGTVILVGFRISVQIEKLRYAPGTARLRRTIQEEFRNKSRAHSTRIAYPAVSVASR